LEVSSNPRVSRKIMRRSGVSGCIHVTA
jgi:hypothetical protein